MDADLTKRRQIFSVLACKFGRILPSALVRKPGLPGVDHIHPLIQGIYKPAWSNYVLSIASMLQSPYHDQTHHNTDGSWWMYYSPKAGGLDVVENAAMVRCMTDKQPVLVLKQVGDKYSDSGACHKLLGLGLIEAFDHTTGLFRIRGISANRLSHYIDCPLEDDLVETALRLEALESWQPFLKENGVIYKVSAQRRDAAFRDVVLENYDRACAVTGQKFVYAPLVEADAAHIIDKEKLGTDDPRNGLALSKSVHWAFDKGIFTISDQYEVIIHPKARFASTNAFPLLNADRKRIALPSDPAYYPHQEALAWHRKNRFGKFTENS